MTHEFARPQTDSKRERARESRNTKENTQRNTHKSRRDRKRGTEREKRESRNHRTPDEPSLVSPAGVLASRSGYSGASKKQKP